jgi:5'-methylthioadenosine phosphorylase
MEHALIGIIGGSGLYGMADLTDVAETSVETPFGRPSDAIVTGTFHGRRLAFLPRHGKGHRIGPSEINYRANIIAMKMLGVRWILSVSAVGSMRGEIAPGHMVVPDQFFDRTVGRPSTFFGGGIVGHVMLADPVCPVLAGCLADACDRTGATVHRGGTYLCMEGPQFSTRAESRIYRQWGVDVIGMTNLPEAKLAREAEIHYATLAMATDYDCWHQTEEDVTIEAVLRVMAENVRKAQSIIRETVDALPAESSCGCADALASAVITAPEAITAETRERLRPLLGRYWGGR